MNCQIPAALAREVAQGLTALSMNARFRSSSGSPFVWKVCRIMGEYRLARSKAREITPIFLVWKYSMKART